MQILGCALKINIIFDSTAGTKFSGPWVANDEFRTNPKFSTTNVLMLRVPQIFETYEKTDLL